MIPKTTFFLVGIVATIGVATAGNLNTPVQADREGTVGETIDETFEPSRDRGAFASQDPPNDLATGIAEDHRESHQD
jgi:hypothetical protein